ncbi:hypothetical protein PTNB29_08950 [Pyrenophora teres f. teres]|nr:hypothetical protein PTNB29_08950 [Pyrenophora teres f. teres]
MVPTVHHPPPPPSYLYSCEAAYPDSFLETIAGPSIEVAVGKSPKDYKYNLPIALVSFHSAFFAKEIARLNAIRTDRVANKKRKLSSSGEGDAACDKERNESTAQSDKGMSIELTDVDPDTFGLFLKFIYNTKEGFPNHVDTPPTPQLPANIPRPPPSLQTAAPGGKKKVAQAKKGSCMLGHSLQQYPNHYNNSNPTSSAPTSLVRLPSSHSVLSQNEWIPPSLQAWLLAQRLGATRFLNFSITRVYQNIGTYFTLTPFMVNYIWVRTSASTSSISTSLPDQTSESSPVLPQDSPSSLSPIFCGILTPSPLRQFLLDIIIACYAPLPVTLQPSRPIPTILRSSSPASTSLSCPVTDAWNSLFDVHKDLRDGFFNGLHTGMKPQPASAYYVPLIRPPPSSAASSTSTPTSAAAPTPASVGPTLRPSADVVVKNEVADHGGEDGTVMVPTARKDEG